MAMAQDIQKYDDDDGRVICNMDVEGMPWHDRRARPEQQAGRSALQGDQMTGAEARQFTVHAVLAALTIVMVFAATWVLFTLFCTQVWLR